jgi:hypothetical protein
MIVPYRRIGNETEARVRRQYEEQGKQEGIVIRQDSGLVHLIRITTPAYLPILPSPHH